MEEEEVNEKERRRQFYVILPFPLSLSWILTSYDIAVVVVRVRGWMERVRSISVDGAAIKSGDECWFIPHYICLLNGLYT